METTDITLYYFFYLLEFVYQLKILFTSNKVSISNSSKGWCSTLILEHSHKAILRSGPQNKRGKIFSPTWIFNRFPLELRASVLPMSYADPYLCHPLATSHRAPPLHLLGFFSASSFILGFLAFELCVLGNLTFELN